MYERPGKELKKNAERYVYWRTIAAAIVAAFAGILLFPMFSERGQLPEWVVFVYFLLIIAAPTLTYFVCRVQALKLYALGQLVDDVQTIRETFCKNECKEEPETNL